MTEVIDTFQRAVPGGPVLVCSGYVAEDLAIEGITSGEYDFLPKPFTPAELVSRIEELLFADS